MMKIIFSILIVTTCLVSNAQNTSLPVKILVGNDKAKPLIFYASGDGGWTDFSTNFINKLNKQGYSLIALNSKDYFWDKKTPVQTATDAGNLIKKYMAIWNLDSVVLIGYSFGADITPFIQNNLERPIASQVKRIVLMLPYITTDFKIHITEMLGFSRTDGYSVVNEVNKLSKPVLFVLGSEKNQFPVADLKIANVRTAVIKGGHDFDNDLDNVIRNILFFIK